MQTLTWSRKDAGRWTLKAANGDIWAVVVPYRSEFAGKNQYKGALLSLDTCSNRSGRIDWTTGIGVAAAKRNVERLLSRHGCSVENYEIAA